MHMTLLENSMFVGACYWVFSALVDSMSTPTETSSGRYRYCYGVLHRIAGNVQRAAEARFGTLAQPAPTK